MGKSKKRLTKDEEFQVMKLVFDKFLLLSVVVIGIGLYLTVATEQLMQGFVTMAAGLVIMIIFAILLSKEYHFLKH